ncbi:dtdp-glucose 4-6-dehydratase [Plasmopara halstedii]|uniref:UDP-glucuronate decarboxylase n=1 Tax=Plasmopara halstedii TaxID=4781 RepID=A0A0P1A499_PLAHL|nr:dtdp-glucose 4-6-dehydratase [Plasmopara halstedii]CEG35313.1 dtdp-glucose 4-6-dehydratase [Plasmopara halstedii]|eukprot:XP_024571682.1 dtdp-glucose 4-6-dehydratase [Plasmopara halstedii]
MPPNASIPTPEMTQSDDRHQDASVQQLDAPTTNVSMVPVTPREDDTVPSQRRRPVSLPVQVQECTMQRILVTGGAGFIGIHLCRHLLEKGHEVICLDNFFTGQRANVLELQSRYPSFEFVRHDITEPYFCEVDQIYNLACPASPVHYQHNPIKTTKVSFLGAINMLGLAKRLKARVFQASTSEVYGDPEVSPQVESYLGNVDCTGVRACYDEGKRVAETLFFEYHRTQEVDVRVARIFNTYGPGMHPYDGRVVSNFIMQALQGEDITIYGSGSQTRSFCYVDDLVEAILRFMDCKSCVGPMNLGNPHEMTIRELAEMVIRLTNSHSRIVFRDLPNNDPKLRKPDITLAKAHLDWKPHVDIEEGLLRTITYFRALDLSKFKLPTNNTAHRMSEIANQVKATSIR